MTRYIAANIKIRVILCIYITCLSCAIPAIAQVSDEIPEGWYHEDIGEVDIPSRLNYEEATGTFTIASGGKEMHGNNDNGHFLYFETEEDKEVVARVLNLESTTRNGKVTIMIRGNLDYDAAMALVEIRTDKKAIFYYRPKDGGHTAGDTSVDTGGYPWWIKFIRQGSYVSAYQKSNADTAQWQMISTPVKLPFKGKAYMGIAVCGGGDGTIYTTAKVDNIVVQDIENPYELKTQIPGQIMDEGEEKSVDVTSVFGHFIGDYWTIQPNSTDADVVTTTFYEEAIPESQQTDGEAYKKYIKLKAGKDGIAAIKLSANVMGYKMNTEFLVEVRGSATPSESINPMTPPEPWKFTDILLSAPLNTPFNGPHIISTNDTYKLSAKDFDTGGEGIAYHDNDTGKGGSYRPGEGVSIGDNGNIGSTNAGEWLAYTIEVHESGLYNVAINLSTNIKGGAKFHYEVNGVNETGTLTAPDIQSWDSWFDFDTKIYLRKGEQIIKFHLETGGFDFMHFTFTYEAPWDGMNSWMAYKDNIEQNLKIVTLQKNAQGLGDGSAFLYQQVGNTGQLEMKLCIDSLKNTGPGSFAGFMIRESLEPGSPFVTLGLGAYEGLRLSYKWDVDAPVSTRVLPDVTHPAWIMLRKYKDPIYGNNLLRIFYSYDNNYWQEMLKYPLTLDFLTLDLYAGINVTGGAYTNNTRKGSSVLSGLKMNINQEFEHIESIDDIDSQKEPLKMNPNLLTNGQNCTISYKIIKRGRVTITVYDSFGKLVETILSETKNIGLYTQTYTPNLSATGVYMLRLVSEGDYQYVKFVYTK